MTPLVIFSLITPLILAQEDTDTKKDWTKCANLDRFCTCNTEIAYGAPSLTNENALDQDQEYYTREPIFYDDGDDGDEGLVCNDAHFDDPVVGALK